MDQGIPVQIEEEDDDEVGPALPQQEQRKPTAEALEQVSQAQRRHEGGRGAEAHGAPALDDDDAEGPHLRGLRHRPSAALRQRAGGVHGGSRGRA